MLVYGPSQDGGSLLYDSPLYMPEPETGPLIFDAPAIGGALVFGSPTYAGGPEPEPDPIIGGTAVHAHEAEPGSIAPAGPINTRRVVRIAA